MDTEILMSIPMIASPEWCWNIQLLQARKEADPQYNLDDGFNRVGWKYMTEWYSYFNVEDLHSFADEQRARLDLSEDDVEWDCDGRMAYVHFGDEYMWIITDFTKYPKDSLYGYAT